MLRNIGGVILGYIIMALTIFLTFSAAYILMGAAGAFQPETYEVSNLWLVTSFILGLLAAVAGGYVCALIARSGSRAPFALAVLVIVLGVLAAVPVLRAANTGKERLTRPGEVSNMEAMQNAVQPGWVALLNPFVGAAGVLVGARLRHKPQE
jgi:ABC-type transport system involved in multi-copper enzyme maturation permease subunit